MKKRKKSLKKKFDIYQKSFSFTHRYNAEKFALDKIKLLKNNFALKINNRLILASIIFSSLFIAVTIKMIEINLFFMEPTQTINLIALSLIVVIHAGVLALRLGISLGRT